MSHIAYTPRVKVVERRSLQPPPSRLGRELMVSVSVFALTLNLSSNFAPSGGAGQGVLSVAQAQVTREMEVFADLQPLDDTALDQQRGGFKIGNFDINVGVTVTTTVEGFATVTTNISVEMPGELKNLGTQIAEMTQGAVDAAKKATETALETAKDAAHVAVEAAKVAVQAANTEPEIAAPEAAGPDFQAPVNTAPEVPNTQLVNQVAGNSPNTQTVITTPEATEIVASLDSAQETANTAIQSAIEGVQKTIDTAATAAVNPTPPSTPAVLADTANTLPTPEPVFDDSIQAPAVVQAALPETPQAVAKVEPVQISAADTTPKQQHPATPSAKDIVAAAVVPEPVAEIIHQTTQSGHVSIISNSLNGISIQQSVAMNLTVDNFSQVQNMVNIQRNLSAISRQIGFFSMRR